MNDLHFGGLHGILSNMRPSKVNQIREQILREIRIGNYPSGALLPPERIMAEQFGVSYMTLRKAVGTLVAERYLERAHSIGTFVRCEIPEHKVQKQLGVVLPAWSAPEYLDFNMYISEASEHARWLVKVIYARSWEEKTIADLWGNSDAMFCMSIRDLWTIPESLQKKFRSGGKPVVFCGSVDGIGGVDAVVDSPEFGLVELACRLYEAGYRRIVQVEQFIRNMAGKRFLNPGMHQIGRYMAEHYPDVVLDDTSLLFEVPRFELPHKVLTEKVRMLGNSLRGALIVTPLSCYWGVMRGLCDSGMRVPREVGVLCYGDRLEAWYYCPRPAVFCTQAREMAFRGIELVRWREQNPDAPPRHERIVAVFQPGETMDVGAGNY